MKDKRAASRRDLAAQRRPIALTRLALRHNAKWMRTTVTEEKGSINRRRRSKPSRVRQRRSPDNAS